MSVRKLPSGEALEELKRRVAVAPPDELDGIAQELGYANADSLRRSLRSHGFSRHLVPKSDHVDIKRIKAPLPHDLSFLYLLNFCDWHDGHVLFDEDSLDGYIQWVRKTPNAYVTLDGDIIDCPTLSSRASAIYSQIRTPQEAIEHAADKLKPIKTRILAATDGTHEKRVSKETGIEPTREILAHLGLPLNIYAPDSVLLELNMGTDFKYHAYIIHGWGGARKTGGQVNKTEDLGGIIHADLYLTGHEHTLFMSRCNYIMPDLTLHRKVFVGCGGFMKYGDYLQSIGRKPPDIGTARIRLEGPTGKKGHKDIHVDI